MLLRITQARLLQSLSDGGHNNTVVVGRHASKGDHEAILSFILLTFVCARRTGVSRVVSSSSYISQSIFIQFVVSVQSTKILHIWPKTRRSVPP